MRPRYTAVNFLHNKHREARCGMYFVVRKDDLCSTFEIIVLNGVQKWDFTNSAEDALSLDKYCSIFPVLSFD